MSICGTPIIAGKDTIYFPGENISIVNNKISAVLYSITTTLTASGWSGTASPYTQRVTVTGGKATSQVDVQGDATAIQQMLDDGTNAIYIANENGVFTAYAVGEKPSANLNVQLTVYNVKEV